MQTWCERQGQVEIGVIECKGRTFAALGASVQGRSLTAYTGLQTGDIFLTTWCGKTMMVCRSEIVEEYHDGSLVLLFRLAKGRFVVGYALGERGMLFRGELVADCTDDEARRTARQIAEHFSEFNVQDEFEASQADEEDQ